VKGRAGARGQAAVELLVVIPIVVLVGLLAWQLVGVVAAGLRAEQRVRAEGLRAAGASGRTVLVSVTERVPALLPGVEGLRLRARAAVRVP
jgi:hypothetical protein